ncbi:MAG: alpha/beta hydrolase [Methylacidiphilales bacterium]|nr:alpha/beta hydrolase [Candidatus Methylacidiphilales bacterium]
MERKPVQRRWYHPVRLLQRLAIYAVIGYVTVCVVLYLMQTSLVYAGYTPDFPAMTAFREAKAIGLMPWPQTTPGAPEFQGYVRADFGNHGIRETGIGSRGTVVVFHGNGGWAIDRTGYIETFSRRGFRTFLYEYPGYGGRPGRPSEKAIVPEARALIRTLDQAGYGPIYIWGESLGSGVAAAVCNDASLPVHGLVLLTPWDNIANVGQSFYPWVPVRWLMIDKYDSIANLKAFRYPICMVRSECDEVIPPPLARNLYAHLPEPKKMIVHAGCGHNDWPSSPELAWWDETLDFIAPPVKVAR